MGLWASFRSIWREISRRGKGPELGIWGSEGFRRRGRRLSFRSRIWYKVMMPETVIGACKTLFFFWFV